MGRHRRGIRLPGQPGRSALDEGAPFLDVDKDDQEAAWRAYGDWEERLRTVASGSDRASDALEQGGAWNGYVRAIAGFMSGARARGHLRDRLPGLRRRIDR